MTKTKPVKVDVNRLEATRNYYESKDKTFKDKFTDTMVVNCALDHALGEEPKIIVKKNKVMLVK